MTMLLSKEAKSKISFFFLIVLVCGSCNPTLNGGKKSALLNSKYCYPDISYKDDDSSFIPVSDINVFLKENHVLLTRYSMHDLRLANALGLLDVLNQMTLLHRNRFIENNIENRVKFLEKKQLIIGRLLVAMAIVSSIAAELDCEGERADMIASFLDNKQTEMIKKLTALSIGLGAAAGISTTVLSSGATYYALGIGGGVGSALLALVTLYPKRKVFFSHPRNLLTDIWLEKEVPEYYPSFIWYILTDKSFNINNDQIISHAIKRGWERFGSLGDPNSEQRQEQIELFFGKGGKYTAENLHARADMINQLQSAIRLINQDLQSLIIAISK